FNNANASQRTNLEVRPAARALVKVTPFIRPKCFVIFLLTFLSLSSICELFHTLVLYSDRMPPSITFVFREKQGYAPAPERVLGTYTPRFAPLGQNLAAMTGSYV